MPGSLCSGLYRTSRSALLHRDYSGDIDMDWNIYEWWRHVSPMDSYWGDLCFFLFITGIGGLTHLAILLTFFGGA